MQCSHPIEETQSHTCDLEIARAFFIANLTPVFALVSLNAVFDHQGPVKLFTDELILLRRKNLLERRFILATEPTHLDKDKRQFVEFFSYIQTCGPTSQVIYK